MITLGGPPPPEPETLWSFHNKKRPWTISLSTTALNLESQDYRDFDDFADEFRVVLGALAEVCDPQDETRLGLRYVNQIQDRRLETRGLKYFIADELVSPIGSKLGTDVLTSLSELRFREEDGVMVLRHGLTSPTTYVLDFDRFSEGDRRFKPDAIVDRIFDYHGLIERLFVWSISQRYFNELKRGAGKRRRSKGARASTQKGARASTQKRPKTRQKARGARQKAGSKK